MAKQKKTVIGVCCICGSTGALTYEHVPPKAAYNSKTAVAYTWEGMLQHPKPKGKKIQGGLGAYTLCGTCNPNTGSWYGGEYVRWARTAHDILVKLTDANLRRVKVNFQQVYPLAFLKQVVTCFFSQTGGASGDAFARANPDLVNFVLNKESNSLPQGNRFYVNLYANGSSGTALRRFPLAGKITVNFNPVEGMIAPVRDAANIFSEIAHPPFQLVMTFDDEPFPNALDITDLARYRYSEQVDLELDLRIASSDSPYPGAG